MLDSFFCKYEGMVSLLSYRGTINTYLSHVDVRIITCYVCNGVQACLRDFMGLVPDHCSQVNIAMK